MFTGKRFRLNKTTVGLDSSGTKPRVIQIPAGSIVEIVGSGETERMVLVQWASLTLSMFQLDVGERGEEVPAASSAG